MHSTRLGLNDSVRYLGPVVKRTVSLGLIKNSLMGAMNGCQEYFVGAMLHSHALSHLICTTVPRGGLYYYLPCADEEMEACPGSPL